MKREIPLAANNNVLQPQENIAKEKHNAEYLEKSTLPKIASREKK